MTRSDPNGNLTTFGYDALGQLTAKATSGSGGSPSRAAYTYGYNQAGFRVAETSTVSSDPTNGNVAYIYDPLGRLAGYARDGAQPIAYGWGAAPNRESARAGSDPAVTTTFDDANRPTADSAGGTYSHDLDGQLTARPGQLLEWDSLGRLALVRAASGGSVIAEYRYDALDRLRVADYGAGGRIRFRYAGSTTAVAQIVDDQSGAVDRSVATSWSGERLLDWIPGGGGQRYYGTNAHRDVTWTAGNDGSVTATLRYDPWGVLLGSTGSPMPDWRFQGSWRDSQTELAWVISRWYSADIGRFISEDSLLGAPESPASRHLYAYAEGEPVSRWDPDGQFWYKVRAGDWLSKIAQTYYGDAGRWPTIFNANRRALRWADQISVGQCLWIRFVSRTNHCSNGLPITGAPKDWRTEHAAAMLGVSWYNLREIDLIRLTTKETGRQIRPISSTLRATYQGNMLDAGLRAINLWGRGSREFWDSRGWLEIYGNRSWPPSGACATTLGFVVYMRNTTYCTSLSIKSHEYIHGMQYEVRGSSTITSLPSWRMSRGLRIA